MENNILVIGNGFDIAHGLDTRYDDFIKYIRKVYEDNRSMAVGDEDIFSMNCIENNGFINYFLMYTKEVSGWVDLEKLIKEIIEYFKLFFDNYDQYIDDGCIILHDKLNADIHQIKENRVKICLRRFPLFYQDSLNRSTNLKCLDDKYYSKKFGLNKREILKLLKNQLNEIIKLLQIYLKNHMAEKYDSLKKIRQIEDLNPSYVISFNYTDTYKIYGIKTEDVFHVHGSLDKDNMVLGFNDDDPNNLDFVYFKKYFQRIQKLTGYIDKKRFANFYQGTIPDDPVIHFYGHSLDKTDMDIIEKLHSMSSGFVIYKYNQEDYEQKVINLIDVFGKERATEMIQTGWIKFVQCEK